MANRMMGRYDPVNYHPPPYARRPPVGLHVPFMPIRRFPSGCTVQGTLALGYSTAMMPSDNCFGTKSVAGTVIGLDNKSEQCSGRTSTRIVFTGSMQSVKLKASKLMNLMVLCLDAEDQKF
ncbi:OLC1v1008501C1 [Oldenlandia corymbosa var. corymbosa]|uniref:OLC1v1008501C1 n=1 Tax=Oldenlandia corymbosa var. corymbosa TaxID=529605 RepID=A0AAV1DPK1_OLDCO|nr:OLC1v1008501C1 [Oldenlandia corymbosa var. corymbosa]